LLLDADLNILPLNLVQLSLPFLYHFVGSLQFTVVPGFVRLVSLIESFTYLDFALLNRQLHLGLQLNEFFLVIVLDLAPLAALIIKIKLSLSIEFLNICMVLLQQLFAPDDFTSQLGPQFLSFHAKAVNLPIKGLLVFK